MSQKPTAKTWIARITVTTIAAGAVLATSTLPASAATRSVSGSGSSLSAASDAAARNCRNNFNGFLEGGWDYEYDGRSYTVTATCRY